MQVFVLPGHIIRAGKLASRIAAQSSSNEAAIRRATLARWRPAMADGLTAERAATAVGVPLSTLYRWQKQPEPRSRRPQRMRAKTWTPEDLDAGADRSGRGIAARSSNVGQGQVGAAAAAARLHRLR